MNEYYTLQGLLALGGAVTAVTMVTAIIGKLLGTKANPYLIWIAFALAELLAYAGAYFTVGDLSKWFVAFFNGCVIFAAAVGINEIGAGVTERAIAPVTAATPAITATLGTPIAEPDATTYRGAVAASAVTAARPVFGHWDLPWQTSV